MFGAWRGIFAEVKGQPVNALYKQIGEDKFYMIGDNRDNSNDSRFGGKFHIA